MSKTRNKKNQNKMSGTFPSTPIKPISKNPKITWAPIRKQLTFEPPTIVEDFQPTVLIPVGGAGGYSVQTHDDFSQITNNMNELNISKGK